MGIIPFLLVPDRRLQLPADMVLACWRLRSERTKPTERMSGGEKARGALRSQLGRFRLAFALPGDTV